LDLLDQFELINLKTLERVELLNRIDSKFIFPNQDLEDVLAELAKDYFILEIEGKRIHEYKNLYYDTSDFQLYRMHHNGKLNRLKVRMRQYVDSGLTYFEAKYKVKASRTDKARLKLSGWDETLSAEKKGCIDFSGVNPDNLQPVVSIDFQRITIARKDFGERATLDINLRFHHAQGDISLPNLVIAEVKQSKQSAVSPMLDCFRKRHYEESGFSKYAMAVASCFPVKYNTFKPNFIKINKLRGNRSILKAFHEPV